MRKYPKHLSSLKRANSKENGFEFDSLMTVALSLFLCVIIVNVTTVIVFILKLFLYFCLQWKKSLSAFCTQEFSVKTSHFFCCKKEGKARWSCFDKEASDSSYHVSDEVSNVKTPQKVKGFKFNSRACNR